MFSLLSSSFIISVRADRVFVFICVIIGLTDSIMGEVLLFTIKKCIGPAAYTPEVHFGWAKIYSLILDVIVPNVVHFEMTHKDEVERMLSKRNSQHITAEGAAFTTRAAGHEQESSVRPSQPPAEASTSIVKEHAEDKNS